MREGWGRGRSGLGEVVSRLGSGAGHWEGVGGWGWGRDLRGAGQVVSRVGSGGGGLASGMGQGWVG